MDNNLFEIKIEGLKYGKIKKELKTDFKTALSEYKEMQNRFKKVDCEISLEKVDVCNNSGKKIRKTYYKNKLGQQYSLETKLSELSKLMVEIAEIQEYHDKTSYYGTSDFNDVRHAIENGMANNLSEEQCKKVFIAIADKAAIRRASKLEMDKFKACASTLNNIKCQINKCIDTCKKINNASNTNKAIKNASDSDKRYYETLLELCN